MKLLFLVCLLLAFVPVRAQAPPAQPVRPDIIRVTIEPGKSVTIYAPQDRVSIHNNKMGESVVEIDTTPRTVVLP